MAVADIVEDAQAKIKEMGGGEQFLGNMFDLASTCGAEGEDAVVDWLGELGEELNKVSLVLSSGPGKPQDLYASPGES